MQLSYQCRSPQKFLWVYTGIPGATLFRRGPCLQPRQPGLAQLCAAQSPALVYAFRFQEGRHPGAHFRAHREILEEKQAQRRSRRGRRWGKGTMIKATTVSPSQLAFVNQVAEISENNSCQGGSGGKWEHNSRSNCACKFKICWQAQGENSNLFCLGNLSKWHLWLSCFANFMFWSSKTASRSQRQSETDSFVENSKHDYSQYAPLRPILFWVAHMLGKK